MIDGLTALEQCINSNANTDRRHYQNLLMHQDACDVQPVKRKDALIIKSDSSNDAQLNSNVNNISKSSKRKGQHLLDTHMRDDEQLRAGKHAFDGRSFVDRPRLEIQVDAVVNK